MLIVIADRMEREVVEDLGAIGEVAYRPDDLEKSLSEADVLVVRSATKVTEELLSGAKKLRMVARAGIGLDNIDQNACSKRGIKVVNTPSASTNAVAELALGIMISMMRNVQKAHHQMKNGIWDKKSLVGREIEGKTLGVMGYGRIGSALGRKANALGMRVISYNPPPRHQDDIVKFVDDLDEFLSQADVISIHAPLTKDTKNLINKETIAKMKNGAYLINTARGGIVDEDALYEGCKSGKLTGAALDVYSSEPYKGKLLELENVYFTPHLGASTKEAQIRIGKELISIIKKEFGG
jgi:D-3-phosphoglycerate dehydrogenase